MGEMLENLMLAQEVNCYLSSDSFTCLRSILKFGLMTGGNINGLLGERYGKEKAFIRLYLRGFANAVLFFGWMFNVQVKSG